MIFLNEEISRKDKGAFKKQGVLSTKHGLTKRAPDVWESAAFSSSFLASSFSCSQSEPTVIPSIAKYKKAFIQIQANLTAGHKAMLQAQYNAPDHALTARQLADAAGYKNFNGANLQYGKIGNMLREALNYWNDDGQASYVLSYFLAPDRANEEEWLIVMHKEVAQALRELNWFS